MDTEMKAPEAWLVSSAQDKWRTRCRMEHALHTLTKGLLLANLLDSGVFESCVYRNLPIRVMTCTTEKQKEALSVRR